jgi:hypothetical protein
MNADTMNGLFTHVPGLVQEGQFQGRVDAVAGGALQLGGHGQMVLQG